MSTKLPSAPVKQAKEEAMYAEQDLDSLDSLLSSIARGGLRAVDGHGFGQVEAVPVSRQAKEGTAIASYHGRPDIDARLKRMETRLAYVRVSLTYMEASRNYIRLRLDDTADDVAYAGDTALAFEKVRRLLYADDYFAPSGEVGLLARVDTALEGIRARLAEIDARLVQIRSGLTYAGAEVSLAHIEVDVAVIEAGLVGIAASIAHADNLLSEMGAGTGVSILVRIPLPSVGDPRRGKGQGMEGGSAMNR